MALVFTARFVDEVLSGAWAVLTPTFRRVFGLSLLQVGLLSQVLDWVALVVEPMAAGLIDVRSRRVLLALGASALAGSLLLMGAAPGYVALLAGFAFYGIGGGPLTHTADVLIVEMFPAEPERGYSRSTVLDTAGALLGPALVVVASAVGASWRTLLLGFGLGAALYAVAMARTRFPGPRQSGPAGRPLVRHLLENVRTVLGSSPARRALVMLFCFDLFEAAFVLKYVWLHESVGLSEPLVAAYGAAEQLVDVVALLTLDRWLVSRDGDRILRFAAAALIVLPVAWVLAPGVGGRLVVGVPLVFAHALIWPLAKSRSLTAVPGLAGATQAITTLFPVIPLALLEARLAEAVGVGAAMAATAATGATLMTLAAGRGVRAPVAAD